MLVFALNEVNAKAMAKVYLSIGSNINKEVNINSGIQALADIYGKLEISSIYQSPAIGFNGNAFLNAVIAFYSQDDINTIKQQLKQIETRHGRQRQQPRFSPRPLDLDILLYDNVIADNIPRGEIVKYAFVLQPLAEIAGEQLHPQLKVSFQQLWAEFPSTEKNCQKINQFFD